jgi:hypothetical protein
MRLFVLGVVYTLSSIVSAENEAVTCGAAIKIKHKETVNNNNNIK